MAELAQSSCRRDGAVVELVVTVDSGPRGVMRAELYVVLQIRYNLLQIRLALDQLLIERHIPAHLDKPVFLFLNVIALFPSFS